MCVAAWIFAPKGENQVYVQHFPPLFYLMLTPVRRLWRSSLILSFVSCYLMWAITFLAQLHPLIEPRRSDLRTKYIDH